MSDKTRRPWYSYRWTNVLSLILLLWLTVLLADILSALVAAIRH